ncbi:MAG: alpha-xylosidase [Lachnospiraceae bacterium]|nr:alpha-xylosidase [Lachnospiraceae bacterium]MBQ8948056.1 alpha-xylosidase [Lachnospiraceae bacterium]
MKFENGCWIFDEGYTCFPATQVYFVKKENNALLLTVPTTHITGKGDTLGGVNLTVRISSPAEGIMRLQTWHHTGARKKLPEFELELSDELPLDVDENEKMLTITSGNIRLEVDKYPFTLRYYKSKDGSRNTEWKPITSSKGRDLACIKKDYKGMAYDRAGDTADTYMRENLSITVDEHIYGCGERFTAFVKNGQTVRIEHKDGGTSTDQAYKNIPFYISDKGYGVFVNHPEPFDFEIGSDSVVKCEFAVEGGYLDYYVIAGEGMKDVLVRYTDLTGKPSLPAPWTYGLWLSTSFTTNYDENTVMSMIDGMLDRGIPLRTFHFDCCWMRDYHWTDFTWDEKIFPDPAGMLRRIKEKGINICVWINPYIAQGNDIFDEGVQKGYFVRRTNGDVWQWDMWQPGMALVDFTNPEAVSWYQGFLGELLDMGVDAIKTDFGERIPVDDVVYYDGSDPKRMHNYYTYLYNKTVFDIMESRLGKGKGMLFARSATAGGQKFPVHWGGDCWSDYESMEESIRGGLSLQMSGFGYWAHDIGGFEQTSTPDVYKRWVGFGLLSSHSRLHGSSSYRVPWLYDEEAVDVVRFFTRLKAKLMPYIYKTAVETSHTGIPTMRAMILEFTGDRNVPYIDKQFMLGDSLLVAPIFNDESRAEFYLPEGTWTEFFTEKKYEGGRWYKETRGYCDIPLFVRPGSVIAIGARDDRPDYDYADGTELRVYGLEEGETASTVVYDMNNEIALTATFTKRGGEVTGDVRTDRKYTIRYVD